MELRRRKEIVTADVLIVGGGIGGMQAAIAAAELGVKTVVAEKADTRRSGAGATGNDHFMCYIPEYHGDDFQEILNEVSETLVGPWQDVCMMRTMLERSFELIKKWESYGINMRPSGDYKFEGHAMPGRRRYHLKYDGHNQKPLLTKKALENGAIIMNKTNITELLVDEQKRVVGALGICLADEEPELVVFQTKTVIIATGKVVRLYPAFQPAFPFNTASCPSSAGAGQAMALRAGARLVNLDIPYIHSGLKCFQRCGKATWIGVLTDINGKPVGPFVNKPTRELGDVTADIWQSVFSEKMEDGTGPVYMNCTQTSEEDLEYMKKALVSEGDTSILDYLDQYKIDLRKEMVEFGTYEYNFSGRGLDVGVDGAASIPGLYATGNAIGNVRGDITSAAVFGQISAESAAKYANEHAFVDISGHPLIEEKAKEYNNYMTRTVGAHWLEANASLMQIMNEYIGVKVRSESLMKAGLKYLQDLKRYSIGQMRAENAHELMRVLEVLDLIDVGIATAIISENRKESRGKCHNRTDYPFTNPLLNNKFQTIEYTENGPKLDFRKKMK